MKDERENPLPYTLHLNLKGFQLAERPQVADTAQHLNPTREFAFPGGLNQFWVIQGHIGHITHDNFLHFPDELSPFVPVHGFADWFAILSKCGLL